MTGTRMILRFLALMLAFAIAQPGLAQDNPFAGGWLLQSEGSALGFQSVKNETKVEQSRFATLSGEISDTGLATVRVALDSIDTKIDLRNVRMRFLFFETFKFPEATVTAQIDQGMIADLATKRRLTLTLPYTLNLHGVKREMTADVVVTLIADGLVGVASVGTIPIATTDFDLDGGLTKLQEAAKVKIVPTGSVTFDWLFARTSATPATDPATTPDALAPDALAPDALISDALIPEAPAAVSAAEPAEPAETQTAAAEPAPLQRTTPATTAPATTAPATTNPETTAPATTAPETTAPETTALETTGNFDAEACLGRFEILSRAGNITFRSASATLNVAGSAILNDIVDIITRCPDIRVEIGGHTDDDGSDATNMRLSERRAAAVKTYLVSKGIAPDRMAAQGYGEANPLVPNDSSQNMARNRRIEFRALK